MTDEALGGRLPLMGPERLDADGRGLYDRLTARRAERGAAFRSSTDDGRLIGPFNACVQAPVIGAGFLAFHEAEERGTPLSAKLREVVILSVGAVWNCAYELYAHEALAGRAGFSPPVVRALAAGETSPALTEEERALQRFALALTRERHVDDETYAACEQAVGRDGVIAATFLVAAYLGTCALLNAFAVPAPDR